MTGKPRIVKTDRYIKEMSSISLKYLKGEGIDEWLNQRTYSMKA
jgi:hypothetical protein